MATARLVTAEWPPARQARLQPERSRVLMAVLDGPEFAASFFGAIKLGAVPVPVNTNLKPHDYAHFEPDGTLRYQGRSDDMLKVSGIWVSPSEVESVINAHPAVLECAVVAIVDQQRLVWPEAFVVLQPGRHAGAEMVSDLREHVRSVLAHHKCPRAFNFVEELPKTATGKILRHKLRESPPAPA